MLIVYGEMDSPISNNMTAPLRAATGTEWTDWRGNAQCVCYVFLSFHFVVKSTN